MAVAFAIGSAYDTVGRAYRAEERGGARGPTCSKGACKIGTQSSDSDRRSRSLCEERTHTADVEHEIGRRTGATRGLKPYDNIAVISCLTMSRNGQTGREESCRYQR